MNKATGSCDHCATPVQASSRLAAVAAICIHWRFTHLLGLENLYGCLTVFKGGMMVGEMQKWGGFWPFCEI